MSKIENGYLIDQAKGRDPDAFAELMQLYMQDMYRVALAILMNDEDAADAIQDTILACWEKIHTLRKREFFKTWLTRILINKCYDIRKKRRNCVELEEYADEKYRIIMTLFYSQGYRIDEIADMLKLPKSTVQTRLQRGRERLAVYYRKYG